MKVVIMESLGVSEEQMQALKHPFEERGVEFVQYARTTDIPTLIEEAKDADAMILANMPMKDEVIQNCPNLKFIDIAFTGVDHVEKQTAMARGIKMSNASGYSTEAVAEWAIGSAISIARYFKETEDRTRTLGTKDGYIGTEIKGKTVGIVGLGAIGSRTAELFHAFGAKVLSYSRHIHEDAPEYIQQTSLEELLSQSDYVCLHCPLNEQSKGLINKNTLALMKKNAVLLNAARGPVVVEEDLCVALQNGDIKAAALDVYDVEPPLKQDQLILNAPHTLLTPHIGFATHEAMAIRAEIVFDNLKAYMDGQQKNIIL